MTVSRVVFIFIVVGMMSRFGSVYAQHAPAARDSAGERPVDSTEALAAQPMSDIAQGAVGSAKRCWPQAKQATPIVPKGSLRNVRLLEGKSQRGTFATGESYLEVIRLPQFDRPYAVEFWMSFDINFGRPNELMIPSAVVVDEAYCEVRDYGELQFEFEYGLLKSNGQEKARIQIADAAPRYILVYADARFVGTPAKVRINGARAPFMRVGQGYTMVRLKN